MLDFAAGCYISDHTYNSSKCQILADHYPQLTLTTEDAIENLLFLLFDEGFSEPSFEEALKLFSYFVTTKRNEPNSDISLGKHPDNKAVGNNTVDLTDPITLELCRRFWEAGVTLANQFKTQYRPYFEQAFAANPYAPNYAFAVACQLAELPLDQWAHDWPDDVYYAVGYSLPDDTVASADTTPTSTVTASDGKDSSNDTDKAAA